MTFYDQDKIATVRVVALDSQPQRVGIGISFSWQDCLKGYVVKDDSLGLPAKTPDATEMPHEQYIDALVDRISQVKEIEIVRFLLGGSPLQFPNVQRAVTNLRQLFAKMLQEERKIQNVEELSDYCKTLNDNNDWAVYAGAFWSKEEKNKKLTDWEWLSIFDKLSGLKCWASLSDEEVQNTILQLLRKLEELWEDKFSEKITSKLENKKVFFDHWENVENASGCDSQKEKFKQLISDDRNISSIYKKNVNDVYSRLMTKVDTKKKEKSAKVKIEAETEKQFKDSVEVFLNRECPVLMNYVHKDNPEGVDTFLYFTKVELMVKLYNSSPAEYGRWSGTSAAYVTKNDLYALWRKSKSENKDDARRTPLDMGIAEREEILKVFSQRELEDLHILLNTLSDMSNPVEQRLRAMVSVIRMKKYMKMTVEETQVVNFTLQAEALRILPDLMGRMTAAIMQLIFTQLGDNNSDKLNYFLLFLTAGSENSNPNSLEKEIEEEGSVRQLIRKISSKGEDVEILPSYQNIFSPALDSSDQKILYKGKNS